MAEAEHREAPHGLIVVARGELVQKRSHAVHEPGMLPRQELERDERRPAARGALVLEPTAQELGLLAEAELPDRPVGDGALTVVGRPCRGFELVLPARS